MLVAWLVPGRAFADAYVTVIKIQIERYVKMEDE